MTPPFGNYDKKPTLPVYINNDLGNKQPTTLEKTSTPACVPIGGTNNEAPVTDVVELSSTNATKDLIPSNEAKSLSFLGLIEDIRNNIITQKEYGALVNGLPKDCREVVFNKIATTSQEVKNRIGEAFVAEGNSIDYWGVKGNLSKFPSYDITGSVFSELFQEASA